MNKRDLLAVFDREFEALEAKLNEAIKRQFAVSPQGAELVVSVRGSPLPEEFRRTGHQIARVALRSKQLAERRQLRRLRRKGFQRYGN